MDLEWDPETDELLAFGFQREGERAYATAPGNITKDVRGDLADPNVYLSEFTKSDARQLIQHGYLVVGPIVDLQVAAWVLNENQKLDLESVVKKYLHTDMDKRLRRVGNKMMFRRDDGKEVPIKDAPKRQLYAYCRRDVVDEGTLQGNLIRRLDRKGMLEYFVEEEIPFTKVLVDMEVAGMPIDIPETEKFRDEMEEKHRVVGDGLHELGDLPDAFNLGSPDQVSDYLFKKKLVIRNQKVHKDAVADGFHVTKVGRIWSHGEWRCKGLDLKVGMLTDTGQPSTSKTALMLNPETAGHPWVQAYLEWQKIDTLLTVFLRKLPVLAKNGRLHTEFHQTGTVTGRLSSRNPNLQNIPKRGPLGQRVRELFRTDEDHPFLMADFSQLETRLMAHFSQDPFLLQIFREGRDPFIELGSRIYGKQLTKDDDERNVTKNVWYAQGYGAYEDKVSEMLTMEGFPTSVDTAADLLAELQAVLPVYFGWREDLISLAMVDGYVTTLAGRHRNIRFSKGMTWKQEGRGGRQAANSKIQGSAADVVRRVMIRYRQSMLRLLLQIHDELVYQYLRKLRREQEEHDVKLLKRMGETGHGFDLSVPLVFEPKISLSWGDK